MPNTTFRDAYTIEEARHRLGGVARQTLYDLIDAGEIASLKIGKRRLVPATTITAFIARRTEETRVAEGAV